MKPKPPRSKDKAPAGKIHPPRTLLLRQHVGTATAGRLCNYEMATALNGTPIIKSLQTGKWYTLPWESIINLAVEAGIDQ